MASPRLSNNAYMATNFPGRLRNLDLPVSRALLPLFEAVVNSIHSVDCAAPKSEARIDVFIERDPQTELPMGRQKRGTSSSENIVGFRITDNGAGFNDANLLSFRTLDSDYKRDIGGRGVGRLLWLKAFDRADVTSVFDNGDGVMLRRSFSFAPPNGMGEVAEEPVDRGTAPSTSVRLVGFTQLYRDATRKSAKPIAGAILEHCLWYYLRRGGAPRITVIDGDDSVSLTQLYDQYITYSSESSFEINGRRFDLSHVKMSSVGSNHTLAWCANDRVVVEEKLSGRIPGLHGRLTSQTGDPFTYACFLTSPFLDDKVRPERSAFNIPESVGELFGDSELGMGQIRDKVINEASTYLREYLVEARKAGRARLDQFVASTPRYKPILDYMSEDERSIDPMLPDKEIDLYLYRHYIKVEADTAAEGIDLAATVDKADATEIASRMAAYLERVTDLKKSDLANFVTHRASVIDLLEQSLKRRSDGRYVREHIIHELLMPMRSTLDDIHESASNLWLVDERLAFHEYLASDKELRSCEIIETIDEARPDIWSLSVTDNPLLVADGENGPLASITVIEIKRPMRADVGSSDEDPILQCLEYLKRIRKGEAQTKDGRMIPNAGNIPGFCYVVCDLTAKIRECAERNQLKPTADNLGYFGYHDNYRAYVEVLSFDRMIASAHERHRAFFKSLGISRR